MSGTRRFKAVLESLPGSLGWTVVRLPFDATEVWLERNRMRVKGTINGLAFRTSLFGRREGGQILLVNKQMQKQAKVKPGGVADIVLEPDLVERASPVPPELAKLLKQDRNLKKFYEEFSPSARNDVAKTIAEPKSPAARIRRAEQLAERMMLSMEGEHELPPILQLAFRRAPLAKAGWDAMTPVQRRGHLMGIFGYQSPESREKRAAKVVEEALTSMKLRTLKETGKKTGKETE